MKRSPENLKLYQESCRKIMERANNMCEVLIDEYGKACTDLDKKRCNKYILEDNVTYTNFLHKSTRNGKSDEWILDPENIIFGCASHHYEESQTGKHVESYKYDKNELIYLPEE